MVGDDKVALLLSSALEDGVRKGSGTDCGVFVDQRSLKYLHLGAGKWRKRAAADRMAGLTRSEVFIIILSDASVARLARGDAEENLLLYHIEYALGSGRAVVPVVLGGGDTVLPAACRHRRIPETPGTP